MHDLPNGDTWVSSRFCGLSVEFYDEELIGRYSFNRDLRVYGLVNAIGEKKQEICTRLASLGYDHKHTHDRNFTVEFFDTEYLKQQLQSGKTINSVPFQSEACTFNPNEYVNDPNQWDMVVRLIDFDLIENTPTVYQKH